MGKGEGEESNVPLPLAGGEGEGEGVKQNLVRAKKYVVERNFTFYSLGEVNEVLLLSLGKRIMGVGAARLASL
ncbi:hypothetical protein NOC27_1413 [Nitrosococcus oceani AFC27]|uniref:Uncharacterized protein n=1 Tax=Nitrosococcus oceani C-27 TaxID=314279 RepID=A0A0E2Z2X9_9GAMM|nr:hypothetical protein NOC27_1413 [Nitrosococcus oceani AFC27]KFI19576.1 hypothetical protein IB75_07905 [Nitrosococcus oceani C-27]